MSDSYDAKSLRFIESNHVSVKPIWNPPTHPGARGRYSGYVVSGRPGGHQGDRVIVRATVLSVALATLKAALEAHHYGK